MSACFGEEKFMPPDSQTTRIYFLCFFVFNLTVSYRKLPPLFNRLLDIVDPEDLGAGPILKLEHEVRSVVKRDGSKYKSCPFDEIPEGCVA